MDLGSAGVSRFADRDFSERLLWVFGAACASCIAFISIFFEPKTPSDEIKDLAVKESPDSEPVVGRATSETRKLLT